MFRSRWFYALCTVALFAMAAVTALLKAQPRHTKPIHVRGYMVVQLGGQEQTTAGVAKSTQLALPNVFVHLEELVSGTAHPPDVTDLSSLRNRACVLVKNVRTVRHARCSRACLNESRDLSSFYRFRNKVHFLVRNGTVCETGKLAVAFRVSGSRAGVVAVDDPGDTTEPRPRPLRFDLLFGTLGVPQ